MNWLTTLFSGGDAIKAIGNVASDLFTNDNTRERNLETMKAQQAFNLAEDTLVSQQNIAQTEVNKIEAANSNTFASSWRPAIGYVCGFALAYSAIIEPIARFTAKVGFDYNGDFPVIDTTMTGQILMGMLGLGALRSFDKKAGTDTK